MGQDVFISYSSHDKAVAERIRDYLAEKGIHCWIDKQNLRLGDSFDHEIEKAIRSSRVLLWVVSQHSIASDFVRFELTTASNRDVKVGPILLEPIDLSTLPAPLNRTVDDAQSILWFENSEPENLNKLRSDLSALIRKQRIRSLPKTMGLVSLALLAIIAVCSFARLPSAADPAAGSFPQRLQGFSASEVLELAYTGNPPSSVTAHRPAIQMAILARRHGETDFSILKDGDSLASVQDDYVAALHPLSPGYLYVFQIDSLGNTAWLFPRNETSEYSSGSNPVSAGDVLQTPPAESEQVLFLDNNIGVEHIYAVFSSVAWPELEQALRRSADKPAATNMLPLADLPIKIPNALSLRGVGGSRPKSAMVPDPFVVQRTGKSQDWLVPVESEPLQASGTFLVIERWFHHVEHQ